MLARLKERSVLYEKGRDSDRNWLRGMGGESIRGCVRPVNFSSIIFHARFIKRER